ncbi:MAG: hypothetical protein DMF51_00165 [Acidobacteria bacterium]|nr:MAG: hypothetical protein DMF51_00165 [Acidobacteriota bacterium]
MNAARASLRMRAAASMAGASAVLRPATTGGRSSSRKAAISSRQAGQPPTAATVPLFGTSRVSSQGMPQKNEWNRAAVRIAGFYHPLARKSNDRRRERPAPGRGRSLAPAGTGPYIQARRSLPEVRPAAGAGRTTEDGAA